MHATPLGTQPPPATSADCGHTGATAAAAANGNTIARLCLATLACLCLALTTGCASVMLVDNQVESYTQWAPSALLTGKVSYIFERLPSQAAGAAGPAKGNGQAELEALASEVLASKGWALTTNTPANTPTQPATTAPAPWRVQVSATSTTLPRAPWDDPRDGAWPQWGLQADNHGAGLRVGGLWRVDMPYHLRTVSVVVRDGSTGQLAFEATAAHDGRWNSTPALWRAMLTAALSDFPHPAPGPRQINLEIPR